MKPVNNKPLINAPEKNDNSTSELEENTNKVEYIDFTTFALDQMIDEDDLDLYDGWHDIFPELGTSRNQKLVDKYGLDKKHSDEFNQKIEISNTPENQGFTSRTIPLTIGGTDFCLSTVPILTSMDRLERKNLPSIGEQLKSVFEVVSETPAEDIEKIDYIEAEMEVYIVPGRLTLKKAVLKHK